MLFFLLIHPMINRIVALIVVVHNNNNIISVTSIHWMGSIMKLNQAIRTDENEEYFTLRWF